MLNFLTTVRSPRSASSTCCQRFRAEGARPRADPRIMGVFLLFKVLFRGHTMDRQLTTALSRALPHIPGRLQVAVPVLGTMDPLFRVVLPFVSVADQHFAIGEKFVQ